jgi:carbamoyl-phosphate synthase large subunit
MPVFSFEKLSGADIGLGPEMKSTGEVLGVAKTFHEALYKAFRGAGIDLPQTKQMVITVKDSDKMDVIDLAQRFKKLGYTIFATGGTARVLVKNGVFAIPINKIEAESPNIMDLILDHHIDLVIDTPSQGNKSNDGFQIRRSAIETGINVLTSLDTANALATSLEHVEEHLTPVDIAQINSR